MSGTGTGRDFIASSVMPPGTSTSSPCTWPSWSSRFSPGATFFWAVDDTLCRKRGLTLYGAGMHYDPLISSRAKSLVSWGHDWVVLTLIVAFPAWAPSKVFALPIAMRLYRNRQGLTKGKKNPKGKKGQKKSTKLTFRTSALDYPRISFGAKLRGGGAIPARVSPPARCGNRTAVAMAALPTQRGSHAAIHMVGQRHGPHSSREDLGTNLMTRHPGIGSRSTRSLRPLGLDRPCDAVFLNHA